MRRAARTSRTPAWIVTAGVTLALVGAATAQPTAAPPAACPSCARGDARIAQFALQPLRLVAAELAALSLADPVTEPQYARLIDLRRRHPALARVGALDNDDLTLIAASLCRVDVGPCVDATSRALRCLADRCEVTVTVAPGRGDVAALTETCGNSSRRRRSPAYGLGFEWGTGVQRSQHPTESRAWAIGLQGRLRFGRHLGAVARVDRVISRDEATDLDGDGNDDMATGPITRVVGLAGPSLVFASNRFERTPRFLRLDVLGGYVATRSQPDESGPAVGVDLAYQLFVFRFGARVVQGLGDASSATMVLAHLGIVTGAVPLYRDDQDCEQLPPRRASPLAISLSFPLGGGGLASHLGYLGPGIGLELLWRLRRSFDAMVRGDLLIYPGYQRDRVIHQAVLAGLRLEHHRRRQRNSHMYSALMGGYSDGAGPHANSGPIVDLSFGWGAQGREGGAHLRLHGRLGLGPDNREDLTLFLSVGLELRLDPRRWRDRS